jgi:hypothetical protein
MVETAFRFVERSPRGVPVLDETEACLKPRMSKKDLLAFRAGVAELTNSLEAQYILVPPSASLCVGDGEAEVMNSDDLSQVLAAPLRWCSP